MWPWPSPRDDATGVAVAAFVATARGGSVGVVTVLAALVGVIVDLGGARLHRSGHRGWLAGLGGLVAVAIGSRVLAVDGGASLALAGAVGVAAGWVASGAGSPEPAVGADEA
ncbi:hypothetical protein C8046_15555 [Serinibacter arcticus]|uniref:Uncharacterized protein n=1 Tax=Serinibacter arcticus TaxID=1655435 RepID=A0A2U1ZXY9_9MICO|nr:hypothetical protein [Serinibacter arcticus]PWD51849.1 hypothetical protein C8046_15555 [Serinibacter arcticus]